MPKEISSTDLQIKLIMQQSRENLRKCALNNFNCPNISPSENTSNKSVSVGVADSVGEALFSLTHADFRTIQKALLSYYHWTNNHDFCFGVDDEKEKQQSLENIARLCNLFINAEGLGA